MAAVEEEDDGCWAGKVLGIECVNFFANVDDFFTMILLLFLLGL
jgi:hypothetical protein